MPRDVLSRPAPPPDEILSYGPDVIDVYRPPQRTGPVVALIHGGFWRAEYDRVHLRPMAVGLAEAGFVVALPEFRRTGQPGGGWPGTFDDVLAALHAIPALLGSAAVWAGHSAGGHLALWAATKPESRPVVSLAGIADLTMCSRLGLDDHAADLLMGGPAADLPERYALADPALLPRPATPVTLLHGSDDDRVPIEIGRSYAGPDLIELPATDHFDLIDPWSTAWPHVLATLQNAAKS